jgi:PLP dependent protein
MNDASTELASRLHRVRELIAETARAAGRAPQDIRLIAASKTQPPEAIEAAIAAGQTDFGENTIQDALAKIPHFAARGLTWHFIGHLQSNKTKFIPGNFSWVHSVDGLKLAGRLARQARDHATILNALIEVNITRDPARHGVLPQDLTRLVEQWLQQDLTGLELRGLMAMAPYPATETDVRHAFAAVRELRDGLATAFALPRFTELSMGMSGDFAEAVREGATMIRVGSSIFGERAYGARECTAPR